MKKLVLLLVAIVCTTICCCCIAADAGADNREYGRTGKPPNQSLPAVADSTNQESEDADGAQLYYDGVQAYNAGDYKKADDLLNKALAYEFPANTRKNVLAYRNLATYKLAEQLYGNGNYAAAITVWTRLLEYKPDQDKIAWAHYYRGCSYFYNGNNNKAITDLRLAMEKYPDWARALYVRGDAYMGNGSYSLAEQDYRHAIKVLTAAHDDKDRKAYVLWLQRLANSFAEKGDADSRVLLACCFSNTGVIQVTRNAYSDALFYFDCAIALRQNMKGDYYCRGKCQLRLGEYPEAIDDYTKAEKLGEKTESLYFERCQAYYHYGRMDLAKVDINRVLAMDPHNDTALYSRAMIEEKLRDFKAAERDYSDFIGRNPNVIPARLHRGMCYMASSRMKDGLADLNYVIDNDPECAEAYFARAQYYCYAAHDQEKMSADYQKYKELKVRMGEKQKNTVNENLAVLMGAFDGELIP